MNFENRITKNDISDLAMALLFQITTFYILLVLYFFIVLLSLITMILQKRWENFILYFATVGMIYFIALFIRMKSKIKKIENIFEKVSWELNEHSVLRIINSTSVMISKLV